VAQERDELVRGDGDLAQEVVAAESVLVPNREVENDVSVGDNQGLALKTLGIPNRIQVGVHHFGPELGSNRKSFHIERVEAHIRIALARENV